MSAASARLDVAVIGGGVAGAAAAIRLARAGRSMLLAEKESGARHKVCGEFLGPAAQDELRALGVDAVALGAVPIERIRLVRGDRHAAAMLPFRGLGLSRLVLDDHLLAAAAKAGVEVRRGQAVRDIAATDGGWDVQLRDGDRMSAAAVFLATGKHELRGHRRRAVGGERVGLKMHFRLDPRTAARLRGRIDLILFAGGYAGLQLVAADIANLCLLVGPGRLGKGDGAWQRLLDALLGGSKHLRDLLGDAAPLWERPVAVTIPQGYLHAAGPPSASLFRLGDQFAVTAPCTGEGIAVALRTARLAVEAHLAAGGAAYPGRVRSQLGPQLGRAVFWARAAERGILQAAAVGACRAAPPLLSWVAARTRLKAA